MERRAIVVRGIVQGVGFRPFVYGLAVRLELRGFVKNQTGSVLIEVEGEVSALDWFLTELKTKPPPLALIDQLSWEPQTPRGDQQFSIETSEADPTSAVFLSPDVATCQDCLAEMLDPADRRYRYPFLNCTNCGPRLTIITGAPYDRQNTTMTAFPMCSACRAEYEDPTQRRFHAQPTACPACGPRLQALDAGGAPIATTDPLAYFAAALRGEYWCLEGTRGLPPRLPGSTTGNRPGVTSPKTPGGKTIRRNGPGLGSRAGTLRSRTNRTGTTAIGSLPHCPAGQRVPSGVAEAVAPGNPWLGVMLPYTPLHHLLLRMGDGSPLVMTSGNRSDEPIAYQDDAALHNLTGIADLFLVHNRRIHVRCDDSVTRVVAGMELPIRRSRGYAPRPIELPMRCPFPLQAVGGQLKGAFALGRDRQAFLSHHLGDLDHREAYLAFVKDVALYRQLFAIQPQCLVHDLHPDYATMRYALEQGTRSGIRLFGVQHHHAHLASCMAEHGLDEPVIGVSFDGTGFGTDGAIWGGEFLVGDYRQFRRAAHFRYVGMPGGEQAIRQPCAWRSRELTDAQATCPPLLARLAPVEIRTIATMLERRLNTPQTSSAGRLFDAVAALAGVRDRVNYEGQAAIELEWLATAVPPTGAYPFQLVEDAESPESPILIDTRPLIHAVAREVTRATAVSRIARRFHSTLVDIIAVVCGRLRSTTGVGVVVLSGGVFLNALLTQETCARLSSEGFRVYRHCKVPPNDGGLSLGQLAIAAKCLGFPHVNWVPVGGGGNITPIP